MLTGGLRLDQAPPLAVPAAWFAVAPLAITSAGAALLSHPGALGSTWNPATIALTHLGTLGLLGAVMFGALTQLIPVVGGARVPVVRIAHLVQGALLVGLVGLVGGIAHGRPGFVRVAQVGLGLAVAGFVIPVAIALIRAPAKTDTIRGMRLALLCLTLLAPAGLWMAQTWAGGAPPGARLPWIQLHFGLGLLGWVGGLLTAVSWQIVPMFWLAAPISPRATRGVLVSIGVGVALLVVAHASGALGGPGAEAWAKGWLLPLAMAPAALAVWGAHPALALRALAHRRRSRPDASMSWWRLGLCLAPVVGLVGLAAALGAGPRWSLAFGWLAIWGWAGTLMLGTLSRIVPFLVWFHRYSPLVGRVSVPSMRELLPERWLRRGLWWHGLGVSLGLGAIGTGIEALSQACGIALLVEGVAVGIGLAWELSRRPGAEEVAKGRGVPPAVTRAQRERGELTPPSRSGPPPQGLSTPLPPGALRRDLEGDREDR